MTRAVLSMTFAIVLLAVCAHAAAQRIAVLPATNSSGPTHDAFALGVEKAVVRILETLGETRPELEVVPPDSVRAAVPRSAASARSALGVDALLSIDITVAEDRATVSLELAGAGRGSRTGTGVVRGALSTLAMDDHALLPAVGGALGVTVTHDDRQRLAGVVTDDAALAAFVEGERFRNLGGNEARREAALDSYRRALSEDPTLVEAAAGIVEVRCRQYSALEEEALLDRGAAVLDSLVANAPDNERVRRARGMHLVASGRPEEGLDVLRAVLETSPDDPVALRYSARALFDLARRDEGERFLRLLIERHPSDWRGYMELGVSRFSVQALDEALMLFSQAAALNPEGARTWSNIGGVQHFRGNLADSIEAFERSLEIELNPHTLRNLSIVYFRAGERRKADRILLDAVATSPGLHYVWGALGTIRSHMGDRAGSREAYERAALEAEKLLEHSPDDVLLMLDIAGYHGMLDNTDVAEDLLEKALAVEEDSFLTLKRIGQAYEVIGNRDRALELIEEALRGGYPLSRIESSPGLRRLREDPRYGRMLDRLGLSRDG